MGEFRQSQWKIGKSSKTYADVRRNSTAIMLHLSALFYCCSENYSAIYVTMEKENWVYMHVCASYPQMQQIWVESHMGYAFQRWAKETSFSWELNGPPTQTPERQTRYVSILALSTFHTSLLAFFHPHLSLLPLSLSLSCSILLLPVIRALWSGPRSRIRVGPAGSLTWAEPGTSN